MPAGRYLHLDPVTGTPAAIEEFSSAAGPAGWRYAAVVRDPDGQARGRVDVTIDGAGVAFNLLPFQAKSLRVVLKP